MLDVTIDTHSPWLSSSIHIGFANARGGEGSDEALGARIIYMSFVTDKMSDGVVDRWDPRSQR